MIRKFDAVERQRAQWLRRRSARTRHAAPRCRRRPATRRRGRPRAPRRRTSVRCCQKMSRRLAPSARRTPAVGAALRNFASSRPTVFTRHTARNANASTSIALLSSSTTLLRLSQPLDVVQIVVERAREAAVLLLIEHVVVEELAEGALLVGGAQFDPACEPDALRIEERLKAVDGLGLPAIGVAVAAELEDAGPTRSGT